MENIAVLKVPDISTDRIHILAKSIGKVIGGVCFLIPLEFEILIDKQAKEELRRHRDRINEALGE